MEKNTSRYCMLNNLRLSDSFFESEVREGFYVSDIMKRNWAARLVVLSEVDRICSKYDLKWFLDCGTLLGAVRHEGYIPWDDDVDILMLRHDFKRFFEVARDELPKEYDILNIHENSKYILTWGRVINSPEISFKQEHLKKNYGYPYITGLDIFPLDGLSDDTKAEEDRCNNISVINEAMILCAEGREKESRCVELIRKIEGFAKRKLDHNDDLLTQLRFFLEDEYTRFPSEKANYLAFMPFWSEEKNHKYPARCFSEKVYMPFENVLLPVPAMYEEVMHVEFGDYMVIQKDGGMHDYPVFSDLEKRMEKSLGYNPIRFRLSQDISDTLKSKTTITGSISKSLEIMHSLDSRLAAMLNRGNIDSLRQLIENLQSIAISIGNILENETGTEKLIKSIEDYCERLFLCYENPVLQSVLSTGKDLDRLQIIIQEYLNNKPKTILFLPCKSIWWKQSMETIWLKEKDKKNVSTLVMPIPYYLFAQDGSKEVKLYDEWEKFSEELPLVRPDDYDIKQNHPDVIVIQYPYDQWNMAMSIPNFFYSENLTKYTDKLVYVPALNPDDPVADGDKATSAIQMYAEQPAVVWSDEILLRSDKMKQVYVDFLTKACGYSSLEYWSNKIKVKEEYLPVKTNISESSIYEKNMPVDTWKKNKQDKRLLLFHVAISSILTYGSPGIKKIKEALSTILKEKSDVYCVFSLHPTISELKRINPGLWKEFSELISEYSKQFESKETGLLDLDYEASKHLSSVDAYYGDAGYLAHQCRLNKIPVMIRMGA